MSPRTSFFLILLLCLVSACAVQPTGTPAPVTVPTLPPLQITPLVDPYLQSSGGGEPRTTGYWLVWNSCAEGNQAAAAQANGGREAGWIILDDLLADPGVVIGTMTVENCTQGVNLLQGRDTAGGDHGNDPAYRMAAQLLAAQLNLAAGAEFCPASDQAVQAGQLLLVAIGFSGSGGYLGPPAANQEVVTADMLTDQLSNYNSGALCR